MKTRARTPPSYTEQLSTFKAGDDATVSGPRAGCLLPLDADPVSDSQDQAPRTISARPSFTNRSKITRATVAVSNSSPSS